MSGTSAERSPTRHAIWSVPLLLLLIAALWLYWPDPPPEPVAAAPTAVEVEEPPPQREPRPRPRVPPVEPTRVITEPVAAPVEPAVEAVEDLVEELTLRDVWKGEVVPDLELQLRPDVEVPDEVLAEMGATREGPDGPWTIRSGADGLVRVGLDIPASALEPAAPEWLVIGREAATETRPTTLWLHGRVRLTGLVRADLGRYRRDDVALDLERVRLQAWSHGAEDDVVGQPPSTDVAGATEAWLHTHRLTQFDLEPDEGEPLLDERGRFEVWLPRLPGLNLHAYVQRDEDEVSSRWRPAIVVLTEEQLADLSADVELVLEMSYRVRGRAVDTAGNPIAYSPVTFHVMRPITVEEFDPEYLSQVGHAYSAGGSSIKNEMRVVYRVFAKTDKHGYFHANVYVDGRTWVEVRSRDAKHNVLVEEVGHVSALVDVFEVVVPDAAHPGPVRVVNRSGLPVRGATYTLNDMSIRPIQTCFGAPLPKSGEIDGAQMIAGHEYVLMISPRGGPSNATCRFTWEGQDELVVLPFGVPRPDDE